MSTVAERRKILQQSFQVKQDRKPQRPSVVAIGTKAERTKSLEEAFQRDKAKQKRLSVIAISTKVDERKAFFAEEAFRQLQEEGDIEISRSLVDDRANRLEEEAKKNALKDKEVEEATKRTELSKLSPAKGVLQENHEQADAVTGESSSGAIACGIGKEKTEYSSNSGHGNTSSSVNKGAVPRDKKNLDVVSEDPGHDEGSSDAPSLHREAGSKTASEGEEGGEKRLNEFHAPESSTDVNKEKEKVESENGNDKAKQPPKAKKETPCLFSSSSVFAQLPEQRDFFIPRVCACPKCTPDDLDPNEADPCSLVILLRPWQVQFLASEGITTAQELVAAKDENEKRWHNLSRALKRWKADEEGKDVTTKACAIALHIWARTAHCMLKKKAKALRIWAKAAMTMRKQKEGAE